MPGEFVAGAYTATYNAKAVGQAAEGFRISHQFFKQLITGDAEGDSPQDAVYRGREQFVSFRVIEALAAAIPDLTDPYGDGTPFVQGQVGLLDLRGAGGGSPVSSAKALVLTAVTGTSAATDGPATITFPLSIIAEDFPMEVLYAPVNREVPMRLRVYADATGVYGSTT